MTDIERLDAAIEYAWREWHKDIDVSEYANSDIHLAVELAATDQEYWDAVRKWAQENAEELSQGLKALLFDALVVDRPSGDRRPVREREHIRLRSIATALRDLYGFRPTRNASTDDECAASIFARLEIEGRKGKPMSERSFERILKGI
ncbi:hypothetical protein K4L04_01445 [Phaeobacter inhibens]|uniref:hypothetical protein n=1 Tax=Phaeobacter inhibens TaxID=221822 RepID=UPI0021A896B6|nr:hypothetical protein [Phaeobacter inhibens]UWR76653.1 hypothetical protein K4L04_01445 [Phaeobacter inhibens]